MKKLIATAFLAALCTGCNFHTTGWSTPSTPTGYAVWTHDPAVANGCNEWDSEPVAEVDNDGQLCPSVLP